MLAPLKLAAGQAWAAWRDYPAMRRRLTAAAPGPPILVTGMYRTGTTWVGAMLTPAGLWHLHEPFNPNRGLWHDELAYVSARAARPPIDDLVTGLLRGRHRRVLRFARARRWFTPMRLLPIDPSRVLLKDPSAALLSEYLVRRHGMRALVLFRHPAAVVWSFLRLAWPTGELVDRLRSSEALMDDWLAPVASSMDLARGRDDSLSGAVLYACVAKVLQGFLERNPDTMTRIFFEDLCADPIGRFRALLENLDLLYDERVREVHLRLTREGDQGREERPHGVVRTSARVAGRWRAELPEADLATIRGIWERFDLPLYREPADWRRDAPEPETARDRTPVR
ncbi:MAG TPA: sulfotransferase [Gemmatimonadota bacterium]|nr:sulfotransferase [Gemmatimonadota bacterium]